jgi:hypothetical protein
MTWPMRFISTDTPATAEAGCLGRVAEARNSLTPLRNFRYSHGQDEKLPPHRFLLHR